MEAIHNWLQFLLLKYIFLFCAISRFQDLRVVKLDTCKKTNEKFTPLQLPYAATIGAIGKSQRCREKMWLWPKSTISTLCNIKGVHVKLFLCNVKL